MKTRTGGDDGLKAMLRAALGVKKTADVPSPKGARVNPPKGAVPTPSKQRGAP